MDRAKGWILSSFKISSSSSLFSNWVNMLSKSIGSMLAYFKGVSPMIFILLLEPNFSVSQTILGGWTYTTKSRFVQTLFLILGKLILDFDILGLSYSRFILGIYAKQTLVWSYFIATIQRASSKGIKGSENGFITS